MTQKRRATPERTVTMVALVALLAACSEPTPSSPQPVESPAAPPPALWSPDPAVPFERRWKPALQDKVRSLSPSEESERKRARWEAVAYGKLGWYGAHIRGAIPSLEPSSVATLLSDLSVPLRRLFDRREAEPKPASESRAAQIRREFDMATAPITARWADRTLNEEQRTAFLALPHAARGKAGARPPISAAEWETPPTTTVTRPR